MMEFSVQSIASVGDSVMPFVVAGVLVVALVVLIVAAVAMKRKG